MKEAHPRFPWPVFLALAAAVGGLAWLDHGRAREALLRRAEAEMAAVADLKARAIGTWRQERIADLQVSLGTPFLARALARFLEGDADPALRRDLGASLEAVLEHGHYSEAIVADAGGKVVLAVSRRPVPVDPAEHTRAAALAAGAPTVADFDVHADGQPHVHVASPVTGADGRLLGTVALRAEARDFLYPVLARWPGEQVHAVSHLVQRMGDQAVVVDPMPEVGLGPMQGRQSISRRDLPPVRAALGEEGVFRAVDPRGVPVLAALRRVEGTGWTMTTRAEQAAVLAPLRARAGWSIAASVLLVAAAGLVAASRFQRQGQRYRDLEADLTAALRERSLDLFVRNANDAVYVADAEGQLVYANDRAGEAYGRTPEELLRLRIDDLRAPRGLPPLEERNRAIDASPLGLVFESVGRRKDATTFPVEVSARRFEVGGRVYRHFILRDITERKRMAAQLAEAERTAALGALAGSLAHEINNPLAYLTADVGAADRVLRAHLAAGAGTDRAELEDAAQALAEAADGAERIRIIVRDLQAFAGAEGTSQGLVDLRAALRTAAALAQSEVRHRAQLELVLGEVPPVQGDHQRATRLFLNLLLNATRAIPEGRASEHRIRVVARTGPGGEAVVEVEDDGRRRAADAASPVTGALPAAELQAATRAAGGELATEPLPGRGTRQRVTFPPAAAPPPPSPAPAAPLPAAASGRVLVVDDEPLVGRAVRRCLASRYAVEVETSGAGALRLLEAGERFDVLVCDLMMPDMTGMELHARVAGIDPGLAARTVFLSGGAYTEATRRFLEEARNPQLGKPFEPAELVQVVAEQVARARA